MNNEQRLTCLTTQEFKDKVQERCFHERKTLTQVMHDALKAYLAKPCKPRSQQ